MTHESDIAARIRGRVVPAVPVPFDPSGQIDAEAHNAYIRWMSGQTVGAVAVWAHTGRGLKLTQEQRGQIVSAWRDGAPEIPLICGVGVPDVVTLPTGVGARTDGVVRYATDMANEALKGGAAACLAYPPTDLAGLPDADARILEYHRAIGGTGLPVIAFFLYEAAGGVSYSPQLIEQILGLAHVVGIKVATLDSVITYQDILAVVAQVPGALPITGEDRFLGYSIVAGAQSALIGMASAVTDCSVALLEAWGNQAWRRFLDLSVALDAFSRATFLTPMAGYVQRMLWALEADGVVPRAVFDPWSPDLAAAERAGVFAAVGALRSR